ncbi:MAG: alginate export family protein [Verrucomicrobiaceae bacterium]|nr:alginate export family protein [Verrucomicrobiaceae bacterium]
MSKKLDLGRWTFAISDDETIRQLAVALQFKFATVEGFLTHSNLIAVLDADGNIVHREESLGADIAPHGRRLEKTPPAMKSIHLITFLALTTFAWSQTTAEKLNPLSFAGGRVVFGIEDQLRFEYRENNYDFNSGIAHINDDAWLLQRFRLSLQLKPVDWLTIYAQGQDAREIGSERADLPGVLGAEGDNPFDLRQLYVELGDGKTFPLSLKVGRQVLLYGDQRLIGPLDWNNISRTFDAVKLRYHGADGLWVDAFISSLVNIDRFGMDDSDKDSLLSGLYAHIPTLGIQDTELYALYFDDTNRNDHFLTLGTHIKSMPGKLGPWDYEAEFAVQSGKAGGRDLSAFASYVEGGYTFQQPWKPRLGLEYSYGSGDGNAADNKQGAFQNLFPTNHLHYGLMDVFSWSNIHNVALHLSAKPNPKLTTSLDFHLFWLDDTGDALRRANATTTVRPITPGASSYVGSELDLLVNYAVSAHFNVTLGYSHFFTGDYLAATGASSDADFVYVMTGVKF